MLERLRSWARALKKQALTVYFVACDPRTPWWVRAFAALVAAYAFSPIDLIPDFIPVLGMLDDLLLVPLGLALVLRLAPRGVVEAASQRAALEVGRPSTRWMPATIVLVWVGLLIWGLTLSAAWWWA